MADAVPAGVRIEPFDPQAASDEDFRPLNGLQEALQTESQPEDPPGSFEARLAGWRSIPPVMGVRVWVARDPAGRVVGEAHVSLARLEENRHLAQFELRVHPEARRQGIGRALLNRLLEAAETDGRGLLITATSSRVPAGEAAMARLGADRGLEVHTNQLDLAELDRDLVRRWALEGPRGRPATGSSSSTAPRPSPSSGRWRNCWA